MIKKNLELRAWDKNHALAFAVQGEADSRRLEITIVDASGQPINLTDMSAKIYIVKPDGTKVFSDATIINALNGEVEFKLLSQATAVAGKLDCQILLTKADNSSLKVGGLTLEVQPSNLEGAVESSNEFSALVVALNSVSAVTKEINQAVVDVNKALATTNAAIANTKTAITAADTAATNANDKATLANTATTQANTAATNADAKADLANIAATNANTATTRANIAATNAENVVEGKFDTEIDAHITAKTNVVGGVAGYEAFHSHISDKNNPHGVTAVQVGASNPNLLINGDFSVVQRITPFIANSSKPACYTIDRWILSICSTSVINTSVVVEYGTGNDSYQTDYPRYAHVVIKSIGTDGTDGRNFAQPLEDSPDGYSPLMGKTVTFSAWVNTNMDCATMYIGYTPKGASTHTYAGMTIPKVAKRHSITAKIPWGAKSIEVGFGTSRYLVSSDVDTCIDVAGCKLEIGSVPTPFVPRPYAQELAMCQRYYETQDNYIILTHTGDTEIRQTVQFKTKKRVPPTLTIISPNGTIGKIGKYNGTTWDDFGYNQNFTIDTNFDKYVMNALGTVERCFFMWNMKADAEIY